MTTLAAANNVYQNTKGFHGRRNAYRDAAAKGELEDKAERQKRRKQRLMMDALGLVTIGIGMNNLRVGWQRREEMRRAHEDAQAKAAEKRDRREKAYSVEER